MSSKQTVFDKHFLRINYEIQRSSSFAEHNTAHQGTATCLHFVPTLYARLIPLCIPQEAEWLLTQTSVCDLSKQIVPLQTAGLQQRSVFAVGPPAHKDVETNAI